jgi:hypothetical protein
MVRHWRAAIVAAGLLAAAGCSSTRFGRCRGDSCPTPYPAAAPAAGVVSEGPVISEGVPVAPVPGGVMGPQPVITSPMPGAVVPGAVVPAPATQPLNPPPVGPQPRTAPQTSQTKTPP